MPRSFLFPTITFDKATLLHDGAAALVADGGGQVGGSAKILDLGDGYYTGVMVMDVGAAIDVAGTDEIYDCMLQGSTSSSFASGIRVLARVRIGANAVIPEDADLGAGRYIVPFTNEVSGANYRYVRFFLDGTGATFSLPATVFLSQVKWSGGA